MHEFIIKLKQRIEGKYFSNFESIFSGSGLDIDDFRSYTPGDNPKAINWKITAKLNQMFINIFQEEKSVDLDVFLDINYNRKGKTNAGYNFQLALDLFGDIVVYAKKHLLPLELHIAGNNVIPVNQDLSEAHTFLQEFPQYLKKISKNYQSFVSEFLYQAKQNKKKRALVIISDFLDIDDADLNILKQLKKDHAVYLFRIPIAESFGQNYEHKISHKKLSSCRVLGS